MHNRLFVAGEFRRLRSSEQDKRTSHQTNPQKGGKLQAVCPAIISRQPPGLLGSFRKDRLMFFKKGGQGREVHPLRGFITRVSRFPCPFYRADSSRRNLIKAEVWRSRTDFHVRFIFHTDRKSTRLNSSHVSESR